LEKKAMKTNEELLGNLDTSQIPASYKDDILNLTSESGKVREEARKKLAAYGKAVLEYIIPLLHSEETHVRWEAVKIMEKIADPDSVKSLIKVFGDSDPSVRWIAAEVVVKSGTEGLKIILHEFINHSDKHYFKQAVHHIVNRMSEIIQLKEAKDLINSIDENLDTILPLKASNLLKKL
jgi:HEAT repeat protein